VCSVSIPVNIRNRTVTERYLPVIILIYGIPVVFCFILLNNVIIYRLTQPFIKYSMNLQLSATCFGVLEPSSAANS
jgi:hypothetical protein